MKSHGHWKVDETGKYVRFSGLTFIVPLRIDGTANGWQKLLHALSDDPVISQHYAVLPLHSLHITVKNHETALAYSRSRDQVDLWFEKVLLDLARPGSSLFKMMDACRDAAYLPVAHMVNPLNTWSPESSTLRLEVQLDPCPEPLRAALVALGSRPEPNFVFHITLAYSYKIPLESERERLSTHLNEIHAQLQGWIQNPIDCAQECGMYYFPSMCEFLRLGK